MYACRSPRAAVFSPGESSIRFAAGPNVRSHRSDTAASWPRYAQANASRATLATAAPQDRRSGAEMTTTGRLRTLTERHLAVVEEARDVLLAELGEDRVAFLVVGFRPADLRPEVLGEPRVEREGPDDTPDRLPRVLRHVEDRARRQ